MLALNHTSMSETPVKQNALGDDCFYDERWSKAREGKLSGNRLFRFAAILNELAQLKLISPQILELGCGTGRCAAALSHIGEVTAIDLSPAAIENARIDYPNVNFLAGDFFDVDLSRRSFDVVISQEVLEHVDDQAGFIQLAADSLRPDGWLILTTPNLSAFRGSGMFDQYQGRKLLQPKENLLTITELRELLSGQFAVQKLYTIIRGGHRGLYRYVNSPRLNRWQAWRWLTSKLPVGLHSVVVAQLKTRNS